MLHADVIKYEKGEIAFSDNNSSLTIMKYDKQKI